MTTPLQRLDSSKLKNNRQAREESFDSILTAPDWTSTTPLALSHAMTPATSHGSGVSKLDTLSSHEPKLKSRSQGASSSIGSSRSSRKPSRAFLMSQPFFRTLRFPSSSPWHLYSTKQTTRQPHASSREHSCETIRTASDSAAPAPIEEDARNFSTKNSTEQEVPLSARQKAMNSGINTQNSRTSQANLLRADNPIASHLQPPIQLTKRRKVSPTLPANPAKDKYRSLGSPLAYRLPTYPMGASNHLNSVSSSPPPHPSNSQFADGSSLFGPVPLNPPHTNSRLSSHSATSSPLSSLPPSSPPLSSLPPSSPPPATPDLLTSPVFGSLSEDLPPSSPPRAIFSPISSSPLSSVPDHIYLNKGPQQAIHHFPTSSPLSSVPDHIYLDIGQPETVWSIPKSSSLSSLPDKDILTLHVSAGNTPGSEGSSASLVSIRRSPSPETVDYTNLVERTCGEQEPFVGHVARQGSLPEVEGAWKSPRPRSPVHRNYALDREESKPLQILPDRVSTYDRHVILPPSQVESDPEPKDEEDDLAWTLQEALQETGVDSRPPFEDEQEDIKGGTISAAAFAPGSLTYHGSAAYSSPQLVETQSDSLPIVAGPDLFKSMAPSWETRTTCLKRYLDEARIMHLWDTEGEQDPIWDFQNAVLIGEHVVDLVCQYLGYQAYLSCATEVSTVVVPPSIFHAVISIHDPGDVHQIVWTPHHPPSRIVLPVVDLAQTHCYLWYGDIEQKAGKTSITLRYLDSLGSPTPIHWRQRFDAVLKVVKYLFPGVDGPIQGEFRDLLGYRQSPGSVDCGIFVCQAVSAIVFDSQDALLDLLPVPVVRQGINRILVECKHGALEYLAAGRYSAKVTLLHKAIWPGHVALQGTSFTEDATTTAAMDSSFSLRRINSTAGTAELWSCPKEKQIRRLSSVPPSHLSNDKEETCSETNGLGAFPISRRATSALSGFSFVYGRSSAQRFPSTPEYHYESLFDDLNAQQSSWPQGKIANGGGRDPSLLLQAALLVDPTRRSRAQSGVSIVTCGGQGPVDDSESSDSINEYIAAIRDIKDPDPCAKVWAFLTGQVAGEQLVLDWLKDTVHPNEDWMDIAHDIDSLSLTVDEPEFSMPVAINAYPPRASTVTSDNGLRIWLDGRKRPLSHFLNFTCFTLGSNNQFRVNVFFPNYVVPRLDNSRYRTFMEAKDYEQWYDRVFICALERVSRKAPPNLRLAILQATTELPPTYASAQAHAHMADGSRNFAGYKITHELLNLITPEMRKIVNTTDDLAKFRGYFFHIWGTNLKTVGQSIQGRSSDNPLLHIFRTYPIVPWQKQNPQDIFVDFAVEVYIDPDRLPADLPYVTLLWNSPVMAQLMGSTYLSTQHDAYMHSHVIGGLRAFTTGLDGHSIVKFQCYHKDMKQTYIHGDNSLGTGFSPQDALGSTKRYFTQVLKLSNAWSYRSSFGSRAEWRANAWAAYQMLQRDPSEWLTRFLEAGAIVVHPTVSVYNLKTYALMLLRKSISLQQQLSLKERSLEEVQLLALVTTYLIKGLVKRPDDMSSSRTMANRLQLIQRAVRYGFPTLQPHMLSDCVTRITGQVEKEEWSILNFLRCKKPGGARLKTSFSSKPAAMQLPSLSSGPRNLPHVLPTRPSMTLSVSDVIGSQLNNADMEWSRRFINERLSTWLWGRFPEHHLRANIDRSTCFNGPWRLSGWRKVAAEDIRLGFRKKARKDFQEIVEELFPMDWIRTGPEGQWRTYQECILDRVRHKIVRRGAPDTQRFALQLREALQHHLHTWEYLPATQKQKVWVLQNPEAPWTYMLHKNPHVVHD